MLYKNYEIIIYIYISCLYCRVTICNPSPEELGYEPNTINL